MYSQPYSYYQSSAAPHQQQMTMATSVTTSGQVWNGQQWVASATNPTTTSYAQAAATDVDFIVAPAKQIVKHGKNHSELVQHYTTYYHHWNAQSGQAKAALASLPPPHPNTPSNNAQREEMERREKWAAYYASNSAALAHYHLALGKSGGVGEPYARPSSPPAPPQMSGGSVAGVAEGGRGSGGVSASSSAAATETVAKKIAEEKVSISEVATIDKNIADASMKATQKKKSRWSSVQSNDSNGKSLMVAADSSTSAEKDESSNRNGLYKKFVQEGQSKKVGNNSTTKVSTANKFPTTHATKPAASSASTGEGGVKDKLGGSKRKMLDRYDSSLSANDSYYGPSSCFGGGTNSASSRDKEEFIPGGLDKPLGKAMKMSLRKEKSPPKKEKKQKKVILGGADGFDFNSAALSERAHRFKGKGGIHDVSNVKSTVVNVEKYMGKTIIGGSKKQLDERDYERMTVKGTCCVLEKDYLRLTSPPRAELVRPQPVLERHLDNLKQSYRHGNKVHNGKVRDYDWYCSQLKSIRQDLTVQRIINAFSVNVYETHAKVALEEDDINEYNQSQTQLKELYDMLAGKEGNKRENRGALKNRNEFVAYRIIYYVFLSGNRKYEGGSSDIFKIMLQLTPEQRKDECIRHALLVRAAAADNDYHKFFQLQDTAPNMSDYLMDKIVPSVRQGALQRICKAYRPSVSTEFVLKELGFDTTCEQEVAGGLAWMESCGCKFDGGVLLTKESVLQESILGAKNSLI